MRRRLPVPRPLLRRRRRTGPVAVADEAGAVITVEASTGPTGAVAEAAETVEASNDSFDLSL